MNAGIELLPIVRGTVEPVEMTDLHFGFTKILIGELDTVKPVQVFTIGMSECFRAAWREVGCWCP